MADRAILYFWGAVASIQLAGWNFGWFHAHYGWAIFWTVLAAIWAVTTIIAVIEWLSE